MAMTEQDAQTPSHSPEQMRAVLDSQRKAFTAAMPEDMEVRENRLNRAIFLLIDHAEDFARTVSEDFGHRSREQTLLTDIGPSVTALKHAKKHFRHWARSEKRSPMFPLGLLGAKASVEHGPKGVVGVVAPWNFPRRHGDGADGGRARGGQPRAGEALRIHPCDERAAGRARGQIFP